MEDENNVVEDLDLEKIAEAKIEDEQVNDPAPDTLGFNGVEGVSE